MIAPIEQAHSPVGYFTEEGNQHASDYPKTKHSARDAFIPFPYQSKDELELSPELKRLFRLEEKSADIMAVARDRADAESNVDLPGLRSDSASVQSLQGRSTAVAFHKLTESEEHLVRELEHADREVRQHEQAHLSAGGQYVVGGVQLKYETGPDGRSYAVGGEVHIDASAASTPEETIRKAQQVSRAAMASANPSSQDMRVAAEAQQMLVDAKQELAEDQQVDTQEKGVEQRESTIRNVATTTMYGVTGFDESIGHAIDAYS